MEDKEKMENKHAGIYAVLIIALAIMAFLYMIKGVPAEVTNETKPVFPSPVVKTKTDEEVKQANIEKCIKSAQDTYTESWETQCDLIPEEERKYDDDGDCLLRTSVGTRLDQKLKEDKEFCLKRYKE